jgi:hypothetical protein
VREQSFEPEAALNLPGPHVHRHWHRAVSNNRPRVVRPLLDSDLEVRTFHFKFRETVFGHEIDNSLNLFDIHLSSLRRQTIENFSLWSKEINFIVIEFKLILRF